MLTDERKVPSPDEVTRAVGNAGVLWDELARRLTVEMGAHGTWVWGGRKYGWEHRYTRAGKPFATLTPQDDGFVALVILGRDQADQAGSLALNERTRRTFEQARQLHDGRWLFLRVETPQDLADVLALLTLKLPQRVRAAMATGVR